MRQLPDISTLSGLKIFLSLKNNLALSIKYLDILKLYSLPQGLRYKVVKIRM